MRRNPAENRVFKSAPRYVERRNFRRRHDAADSRRAAAGRFPSQRRRRVVARAGRPVAEVPAVCAEFREFNGLLVYCTQPMSYRCAIREARVGIDSAVPDKVLKMPPCDPRDPSVHSARSVALFETAAGNQIGVGGIDLSRRQRIGDKEFSALSGAKGQAMVGDKLTKSAVSTHAAASSAAGPPA